MNDKPHCENIENCHFKMLLILFGGIPSGNCQISWHNREVKHYEDIKTEAKVNKEDMK